MSDAAPIAADAADPPFVLRADRDAVATLTLNRPGQLNAMSDGMLDTLQAAIDEIAQDADVRVVVIAAAGRAFCSGHNLKDLRANYTYDYQKRLFSKSSRLMVSLLRLPQPVIARVHGMTTAAGCQLVATCDLAIAGESATFATSGINNGLFCSTPGVAVGRTVSRKHALEMLLTGDFISAERAAEIGLINRAVPDDELDTAIDVLAGKLASKSAFGLALGKRGYYRQMEMGLVDAYDFMGSEMARNVMDRDAAEGFDAFIEKREPVWDQTPRENPRGGDDEED